MLMTTALPSSTATLNLCLCLTSWRHSPKQWLRYAIPVCYMSWPRCLPDTRLSSSKQTNVGTGTLPCHTALLAAFAKEWIETASTSSPLQPQPSRTFLHFVALAPFSQRPLFFTVWQNLSAQPRPCTLEIHPTQEFWSPNEAPPTNVPDQGERMQSSNQCYLIGSA